MKEDLVSFFRKIKTNLQKELYPNEESVRAQIVYPILTRLGWDQEDPRAVRPEYDVSFSGGEKGKVDIALFARPEGMYGQNQASVYIEVKRVGKIHKARDQLFEYFKSAPPGLKAIVTDGQIWRLYAFFKAPPDNLVWECDFLKDEAAYGEQADEFVRFLSLDSARQGRIEGAVNERLQENAKWRGVVSGSGSFVDKNHYKMRILLSGYEESPKGNHIPQKSAYPPPILSPHVPPSGAGTQQEAGPKKKKPKVPFFLFHNRNRIEGPTATATDAFKKGVEMLLTQKLTAENVTSFNQALQGVSKLKKYFWVEGTQQDPPSYLGGLCTLKLPFGSYTLNTHSNSWQKRDHFLELCRLLGVSCSGREFDIGRVEWCCFLNKGEEPNKFSPSVSPWPTTSHASFGRAGSYNRPPGSAQGAIKSTSKSTFFLYRHGRRVIEGTTAKDVFVKGVEILLTQKLTEEKGTSFNQALQDVSKLKNYFWIEGTRDPPSHVPPSALYTFRLPVGSYKLSTSSSSYSKQDQFLELCRLLGVSCSGREADIGQVEWCCFLRA